MSFCWPAPAMWVWASMKPGMTNAPLRSTILVAGDLRRRMLASLPTAMILPLCDGDCGDLLRHWGWVVCAEVGSGEDVAVEVDDVGIGRQYAGGLAEAERGRQQSGRE